MADLLLSSLCDEVGDELYEMDEAVRSMLLERLATDTRFGPDRLRRVAAFLDDYVEQQLNSDDIDTRDFAQAQHWAALAYTAPSAAASELARAFAAVPLADKPEVVRIAAVVEALATPLESFPTLLTYAQAAQSLARGRDHPAVQELQSLAGPENRVEVVGVSVPVPFAMDADLVFIHGFWSSPAIWDRLVARVRQDPDLAGLRIHAFGYESPKLRWPGSPTQIPDYNDIAQSLPAYLAAHIREGAGVAIVTHSQGGLILQRYLAWMLAEGRGRELAKIRLIVMLSCPNEGSEYLRSIRSVAGLGRRPQAGQLDVLTREVGEARRVVLRQIIYATTVDGRHCPIPVYVYSGRTDNVVLRETAQSVFPNAEVLPGDHFSILDPDAPGNLTFAELKRRLLETFTAADNKTGLATAPRGDDGREGIAPPSTVDDDADPGGERVVNEPGPGPSQAAIAAVESSPGDADPIRAAISVPSASRAGDGASTATFSSYEESLQVLEKALDRIVPAIFRDPRISAAVLNAADAALVSLDPLVEALRAAAEAETQQRPRFELQQLDGSLRRHQAAISQTLSALHNVRSETAAEPLCHDLAVERADLLAIGARAIRQVT